MTPISAGLLAFESRPAISRRDRRLGPVVLSPDRSGRR